MQKTLYISALLVFLVLMPLSAQNECKPYKKKEPWQFGVGAEFGQNLTIFSYTYLRGLYGINAFAINGRNMFGIEAHALGIIFHHGSILQSNLNYQYKLFRKEKFFFETTLGLLKIMDYSGIQDDFVNVYLGKQGVGVGYYFINNKPIKLKAAYGLEHCKVLFNLTEENLRRSLMFEYAIQLKLTIGVEYYF